MIELFLEYWTLIIALCACGLFSGLAAGLFGIGGGAVIVPVLIILFYSLGYTETASHVAIATSLATIILTSTRSVLAHHERGAVDWTIIQHWGLWIMLGAVIGQLVAGSMSNASLKLFFGLMALVLAAQLYFGRPDWRLAADVPRGGRGAILAGTVGGLSAIMGIGGGTFGVTMLTLFGRSIHQAVATAAGFGVAIGLPSALTAISVGWGREGLPPFSLGYVNVAAFALISAFTIITAPIGARLAHRLNPTRLKKLFAVLLALVSIRLISDFIVV